MKQYHIHYTAKLESYPDNITWYVAVTAKSMKEALKRFYEIEPTALHIKDIFITDYKEV